MCQYQLIDTDVNYVTMTQLVLHNLQEREHDIKEFVHELYNSIEVLEYMLYYDQYVNIAHSTNYMSCNILCCIALSCKRHNKYIYSMQFDDDARRSKKYATKKLEHLKRSGRIKILKKTMLIKLDKLCKSNKYSDIINLYRFIQSEKMLYAMISLLHRDAIVSGFVKILCKLMCITVPLNNILTVNSDNVIFGGINLKMPQSWLHENFTCAFEASNLCSSEIVITALNCGYNFYTTKVNSSITIFDDLVMYDVKHDDWNNTIMLFKAGYNRLTSGIHILSSTQLQIINRIKELTLLCSEYSVNISKCYVSYSDRNIPLIFFSTVSNFDALIKCNLEYTTIDTYIYPLVDALILYGKMDMFKHYTSTYSIELKSSNIDDLVQYADDDDILELIDVKTSDALLRCIKSDVSKIHNYRQSKIVNALIRKYTTTKPLDIEVINDYLRYSGSLFNHNILDILIQNLCGDINDIDTRITSKIMEVDIISKCSSLVIVLASRGYNMNSKLYNDMDLVELYVKYNEGDDKVYNAIKIIHDYGYKVGHISCTNDKLRTYIMNVRIVE